LGDPLARHFTKVGVREVVREVQVVLLARLQFQRAAVSTLQAGPDPRVDIEVAIDGHEHSLFLMNPVGGDGDGRARSTPDRHRPQS
jgi:hypothetical protein